MQLNDYCKKIDTNQSDRDQQFQSCISGMDQISINFEQIRKSRASNLDSFKID